MPSRQRVAIGIYKKEKLTKELRSLQSYGTKRAREMKITEKGIERLIFEGR